MDSIALSSVYNVNVLPFLKVRWVSKILPVCTVCLLKEKVAPGGVAAPTILSGVLWALPSSRIVLDGHHARLGRRAQSMT